MCQVKNQLWTKEICAEVWSQFCREPLSDRTFTFWELFYRVMNLSANQMRGPWNDGNGWGIFLLRFSDSELGGVTIAYVRQENGKKTVLILVPFTTKELSQQSISDKIFDIVS